MKRTASLAVLCLVAAGAAAAVHNRETTARFYYDLGKDSIDVSSYPAERQRQYAVFAKTCSQCHTLARPINSPVVTRQDWKRFVSRMHQNALVRSGAQLSREDARTIIDFLAFDAQRRKVARNAEFAAESARLKALFKDEQARRQRETEEAARAKALQPEDPTGVHPEPSPGERR